MPEDVEVEFDIAVSTYRNYGVDKADPAGVTTYNPLEPPFGMEPTEWVRLHIKGKRKLK